MVDKGNHSLIVRDSRVKVQAYERGILDKLSPDKEVRPIITCCPEEYVRQVAFTPEGRFLAVCIDRSILMWDLKLNKWVQKLSDKKLRRVNHIEITSDGEKLISGDNYKVVEWDLRTGRSVGSFKINHHFTVSPDGKTLVAQIHAGYPFTRIGLWDLMSGEMIKKFSFSQGSHSTSLALSPDGKLIAVAEFVSGSIRVFDLSSEKLIFTLAGHSGSVNALIFTPDGTALISGGSDQLIRFWRMTDGACFRTIPGNNKFIASLAITPDGGTLLSGGGDRMICVWNLRQDRIQQTLFGHDHAINSLAVSSDGQMAASGGYDDEVYLWDLKTGKVLKQLKAATGRVAGIASTQSGTFISSFRKDMRTLDLRKFIADGKCHYGKLSFGEDTTKTSVATHPEGTVIAVGMRGRVCLYDAQTGLRKAVIGGFDGPVRLTAFSPDGRTLLSGTGYPKQRNWCIYNLQTGERTYLPIGESKGEGLMEGIAFSPDGMSFLIVGYDHFELWNLKVGRCEWAAEKASNLFGTKAVALHPFDQTFVSSGQYDGEIHIWDLETGERLRSIIAHTRRVTALGFNQNGKLLLSGSEGGIVNYWEYETGKLLATAYTVDAGYLWTTPPDDFAKNGWLHTNRPDLISLAAVDPNDGELEYISGDDKRFKNYMQIYNDGEMVMTRIHDWERYQDLLRLRIENKGQIEMMQIEARTAADQQYQLKPGGESEIEKEKS